MKNFNRFHFIAKCVMVLLGLLGSSHAFASWTSSGQYDISWYKSSQSEFVISTNKQFAGIAYLIDNGYTTFSGKTIKLDKDIDLSSNPWITVNGTFCGKLDGQKHEIKGVCIKLSGDTYPKYGMFKDLRNAEISNVSIVGNINLDYGEEAYKVETQVGLIAAYALNTKFQKCETRVNVTYDRLRTQGAYDYEVNMGGFVGYAEGCSFTMCRQTGSFLFKLGLSGTGNANTNGGYANIGGLVGKDLNGKYQSCGVVSESFGARLAASKEHKDVFTRMGGIVGYANDNTQIDACYANIDEIETWLPKSTYGSPGSPQFAVGGIAGSANSFAYGSGHILNCYSSCKTLDIKSQPVDFGGIAGRMDDNASARYKACFSPSDLYYNPNANVYHADGYDGSTSFPQAQMKTNSFLEELNLYPSINGLDYEWCFQSWNDFPVVADPESNDLFIYEIIEGSNGDALEVSCNRDIYEKLQEKSEITIPSTAVIDGKEYVIESIAEKGFENLKQLEVVNLPGTLKSIQHYAFMYCDRLQECIIPANVGYLGQYLFSGCYKMAEIKISPLNESFKVVDGVLFTSDMSCLQEYPSGKQGEYSVPSNVEKIQWGAFYDHKYLTKVNISSSVTNIGGSAFCYCKGLTEIHIPESVCAINQYAFYQWFGKFRLVTSRLSRDFSQFMIYLLNYFEMRRFSVSRNNC